MVPSKPPASTLEPSTQESTSPTRLPPRRPNPLVESRSHTDSDQELSPSERSEDSRNPLSSSSENSHSRDSSERLPLSSETTSDSSPLLSLPSRRPPRLTWSVFSRTPTSAPSTPRELPSCQRTCSSPAESVESAPEREVQLLVSLH